MPYNRKAYAPYSQSAEAGITQAPVDGFIEVEQYIKPVIQAGTLGTDGKWLIAPQSDTSFFVSDPVEGIPNSASVLFPNTADADFIDMTGFDTVFLALKVTNAGNYGVKAVMGPDSQRFANLSPVNPAVALSGNTGQNNPQDFTELFNDSSQAMTADVWNIFVIQHNLAGQKLLNFQITNSSGDVSTLDFAYLRVI